MNPIYRQVSVGDAKFQDSAGAFLINELEKLDPIVHEPLMSVTFHRDLPIRSDATFADEYTSFANIDYGMVGGIRGDGTSINWVQKETNVLGRPAIDVEKTRSPFRMVAYGCSYDVGELASSMQLNRPIDQLQIKAVNMKHQMDCDRQAYIGNADFNDTGLVNNADVPLMEAPAGSQSTAGEDIISWDKKLPEDILNDINTLLQRAWDNSADAVAPSHLLVPTTVMPYLIAPMTHTDMSVLEYVKRNSIYRAVTGNDLTISPVKWLNNAGQMSVDGTSLNVGRAVAYTPREEYVRFPMTPLSRTALQFDLLSIKFAYYGRIGCVEVVKPETMFYMDGVMIPNS